MLTEAALAGAVDTLVGLKENVILGHLIPAGTAFNPHLNLRIKHLAEPPAAAEAPRPPRAAARRVHDARRRPAGGQLRQATRSVGQRDKPKPPALDECRGLCVGHRLPSVRGRRNGGRRAGAIRGSTGLQHHTNSYSMVRGGVPPAGRSPRARASRPRFLFEARRGRDAHATGGGDCAYAARGANRNRITPPPRPTSPRPLSAERSARKQVRDAATARAVSASGFLPVFTHCTKSA